METQELHRGRLIDHLHLVVRDLPASQTFYTAVLEVLDIPLGGAEETYFWADELFVSTADSAGRRRPGQRRAGRTSLPPRLLRRLRAGPGRQQYRGRVPRRGQAQRAVSADYILSAWKADAALLEDEACSTGAFHAEYG